MSHTDIKETILKEFVENFCDNDIDEETWKGHYDPIEIKEWLSQQLDRIREEEYRKGYTEGGKDAYSVIKAGSDLNREIKKFNSLTEK